MVCAPPPPHRRRFKRVLRPSSACTTGPPLASPPLFSLDDRVRVRFRSRPLRRENTTPSRVSSARSAIRLIVMPRMALVGRRCSGGEEDGGGGGSKELELVLELVLVLVLELDDKGAEGKGEDEGEGVDVMS